MRAVMAHSQWQAPVGYAMEVFETNSFDRIAAWGTASTSIPNGELWLFSDDNAAMDVVNGGGQAGPYATGLSGHRLFEHLPNVARVWINPGTKGESWVIEPRAFDITRLWAKAVKLELLLAKPDATLVQTLSEYDAYTILVLPSGGIATAVGAGGMQNPGMLFTTPDCAEAVLREIGPQAATLKRVVVAGKQLFADFEKLGIDGFVVNPRGPGASRVLTREICVGIREVAKLAEEAAYYAAKAAELEGA